LRRTPEPSPNPPLTDSFDFSALYDEYRDESQQQLALLDAALLRLEESGELPEAERTELLRALHTLKGNSGMLALHAVVDAVHVMEASFKEGGARWPRETVDAFFEAAAALRRVAEKVGTKEQAKSLERLAAVKLEPPAFVPSGPGKHGRTPSSDPVVAPERSGADEPAGGEEPVRSGAPRRDAPGGPGAADTGDRERSGDLSDSAANGGAEADLGPDPAEDGRREGDGGAGEVLRVPFSKLDALLNRVGELVSIEAAMEELLDRFAVELEAAGARRPLEAQVESLGLVTDALRDATMDLRLVTVGRVFQRFPSLARDLARKQEKQVRVILEGEQVELDKSTVDALADPLLHLVRNAVDHGIGTPDERRAQGRPETGTITLRAERTGDRVMVEVSDDGGGLDREAILKRARAEGIVGEHEHLHGHEVDELIFRSGFSTRSEATTVSGRGVGLEVVRRRVNALRGALSVREVNGGGTRFVLSLPLTLAIVPALLFETGGETLAVPAAEVQETLRRVDTERAGGAEVLRVRDDLIPVARAGRILGWESAGPVQGADEGAGHGAFAIVIRRGTRSAAVLADRLLEQRDVVVRALPRSLGSMRGISGATVTPGGKVVLLLDSSGILDLNLDLHRREARAG
jgi:two-component system, chemotaxis family, sensor kinase CheA